MLLEQEKKSNVRTTMLNIDNIIVESCRQVAAMVMIEQVFFKILLSCINLLQASDAIWHQI